MKVTRLAVIDVTRRLAVSTLATAFKLPPEMLPTAEICPAVEIFPAEKFPVIFTGEMMLPTKLVVPLMTMLPPMLALLV